MSKSSYIVWKLQIDPSHPRGGTFHRQALESERMERPVCSILISIASSHTATASRVRQPGELFSPPRCITIKCRFISASFTFRLGAAAHAHYLQHLTLQAEIFRYEWVDLDHMAGLGIDDRGQPRGEICLFADLEREINKSNWIFSRSKSLQIRG